MSLIILLYTLAITCNQSNNFCFKVALQIRIFISVYHFSYILNNHFEVVTCDRLDLYSPL